MSTGSHGPRQLKDRIVQSQVHRERDQFIAAIHEDDICRLAPSHHNGDPCKLFKPASPDKTAIPLPKIYAYSLDDGPEPLSSFLILEHVEGQKLSSVPLKTPLTTSEPICGFEVRKKTATIDMNMQELEGLEPFKIQGSYYDNSGLLTSANDYMAMLLQIANNAFVEGRSSVFEKGQGEDALYHLQDFREYAESWVDRSLDQGPYVLVHGDLEPFNLIVNDTMDIISVLDWEWSRVVPRQFFKPPLWLRIPDTTKLAWDFVYNDYLKSINQLQAIIKTRELEKYGNTLLSEEWERAKENSGFLVANALENWTAWTGSPISILTGNVTEARSTWRSVKLSEGIAYEANVEQLQDIGLAGEHKEESVDAAPGCKDKPTSTDAILKNFLH
ncbi:hypothetical protein IFR05_005572 [Cadophora sp. M221]|nr:hypothetical protein IFR05_005572 [Cadophora sp. M221]